MTAKHSAAPELIVMLTYDDKTVANAHEVFDSCRSLDARHWGFKDIGLPDREMRKLAGGMKDAGCQVYLEVVSLSEAEALKAVEIAATCGCDAVMGSIYSSSIHETARHHGLQYFPFVGEISGHPSVLGGTVESIASHARHLSAQDVDGMDLLTYRFTGGDPDGLLKEVVASSTVPVVSAGSISSYERIQSVWDAGAHGFTIGSAFFDEAFAPTMSFRENLASVLSWLAEEESRRLAPSA